MSEPIKIVSQSSEPEVISFYVTAAASSDDPTNALIETYATRIEPDVTKVWVAVSVKEPEILKVPVIIEGEEREHVWMVMSMTELKVSTIPVMIKPRSVDA